MNAMVSYETAAQEDRCAPRVPISLAAMLRPSGSHAFHVTLIDLSIAGFAAEVLTSMRPGTRCWLTLPGLGGLESRIVWNTGELIGCEFAVLLNAAVFDWIIARSQTPEALTTRR